MRPGALAAALSILLAAGVPAMAANWVRVGADMHGYETYLDVESFARVGQSTFRLQVKSVHPPAGANSQAVGQAGEAPAYSLEDFRINCRTNTISTEKIVVFGQDGQQLAEMAPIAARAIEPESLPDFIAKEMCPKLTSHE